MATTTSWTYSLWQVPTWRSRPWSWSIGSGRQGHSGISAASLPTLPPLYGDFDVKNKMRHKHLFLSAPLRCDEQGIDSSLSLVAQVLSRERLWVLIPLVADGPSVSTISAFGNGGPTIPKHMWVMSRR